MPVEVVRLRDDAHVVAAKVVMTIECPEVGGKKKCSALHALRGQVLWETASGDWDSRPGTREDLEKGYRQRDRQSHKGLLTCCRRDTVVA